MSKKFVIMIIMLFLVVACDGLAPATGDDPDADTSQSSTESREPSTDASEPAQEVEEASQEASEPVTLRVGVSLNAEALADFERGLAAIQEEHANWTIDLESVPHEGRLERIATQIASGTLPDVLLVDGLSAQ